MMFSVFVTFNENITFTDYVSVILPPDCSKLSINQKNENKVIIYRHDVIVIFFDVVLFVLSSLVTGPSFISISSLVLELWQITFMRDWPDIRKSEIPPSEFCSMSGNWGELGIPNLAWMSLIKSYYMLQNTRVTAFTVSELLRENQQGVKLPSHPPLLTQIRVKKISRTFSERLINAQFTSSSH